MNGHCQNRKRKKDKNSNSISGIFFFFPLQIKLKGIQLNHLRRSMSCIKREIERERQRDVNLLANCPW